jgi:DNA-binding transcriptional LysR family regulator
LNLDELDAFVAVIDHGSIVAAAARLNLTQSAVTRRIQNLEDSLGTSLLNRRTRPISATELGTQTDRFARGVISSIEDLKSSVSHKGVPSGEFRFGVCAGLGEESLLEPIKILGRLYPKLQLRASARWSSVLVERLRSGELDAAVVLLAQEVDPPPGLQGERIGTDELAVLASRELKFPKRTTLNDLKHHVWILNPEGCIRRDKLRRALLRQNIPFKLLVEADGFTLQLSLIEQKLGIGLTVPMGFTASSFRDRLQLVRVKDFLPKLNIWLLHTKHTNRLAKPIQTLKDIFLRAEDTSNQRQSITSESKKGLS